MNGAERYARVNLLADPLYGYIEVTKPTGDGGSCERDILDSPWLQRLRKIHQMQSTWWIFPTAEHTRFAHLLGSMHLSSAFSAQVDQSLRESFPETPSPALVDETLRMAGLLHDVGHGPFCHFFDHEFLSQYSLDHEDVGRHLILGPLADMISSLTSSPRGPFEKGERVDPYWVAWLMAPMDLPGYTPPAWVAALKPILCGPATVDNLDYVRRDAYMCGVSAGPVDVSRIVHYTFVTQGTTVLHVNALGALEMFLAARLYMYMGIYLHRTGRRFDLSMHEIFGDTIRHLLPGNPLEHLDEYQGLTDWSLLETVRLWGSAPLGSDQRRLGDAWGRITRRDLPWTCAHEIMVRRDADLANVEADIRSALPASARATEFVVDVAAASVASYNPMHEKGLLSIYDPMENSIVHSRTAELVARLPQYNQMVRIFTKDQKVLPALSTASRKVLRPISTGTVPSTHIDEG